MLLPKSHICEIFGSLYMDQNALSHSDRSFYRSSLSPEQIDEIAWLFVMSMPIHKNLKIISNFLGRHSQEWLWPFQSRESKIGCISRMNRWNKLIFFCMLIQVQESQKLLLWFLSVYGQKLVRRSIHGTLKSAVSVRLFVLHVADFTDWMLFPPSNLIKKVSSNQEPLSADT